MQKKNIDNGVEDNLGVANFFSAVMSAIKRKTPLHKITSLLAQQDAISEPNFAQFLDYVMTVISDNFCIEKDCIFSNRRGIYTDARMFIYAIMVDIGKLQQKDVSSIFGKVPSSINKELKKFRNLNERIPSESRMLVKYAKIKPLVIEYKSQLQLQ